MLPSGQIQPGRMALQIAPPPTSQQRSHRNFQFEGLIPDLTSKIFAVLTFLIVGGACIGNSIIDSPHQWGFVSGTQSMSGLYR